MPLLAYLLARFSEPSSYAGLGAVLALTGWNLPDTLLGQLVQLLAAACGLLALCLKERGLIRAIVLIFAATPVLAGCGGLPAGLGSAGSVYTALDHATEAAAPAIVAACGEYRKAKGAAHAVLAAGGLPSAVAAKVASIESYGDAACAVPPAGDPASTAIWLGRLAGQVATLSAAK